MLAGTLSTLKPYVTVLERQQRLYLNLSAAILDVDDTQIDDSSELIHNGHQGRFAHALASILSEAFDRPITFSENSWAPYKKLAGRAEIMVCHELAKLAESKFYIPIDPHELMRRSRAVIKEKGTALFRQIRRADGIREILLSLRAKSIACAACSASSEEFVTTALSHFDLLEFYNGLVCSASKRIFQHIYSGKSMLESCALLKALPQHACVIGDSVADYASASLAGVPVVVLRVPTGIKSKEARHLFEDLRSWENEQLTDNFLVNPAKLYVITCFSQIASIKALNADLASHASAQVIENFSPTTNLESKMSEGETHGYY